MVKQVRDCVVEAERFRMKAKMYARLRCFVVTHFDVGCKPAQIPPDLFNEVAEEMLVRANEAEQQAQLVMAMPVNDNTMAFRRNNSDRQIRQAVTRKR